jgi:hypothetical protein
MNAVFETQAIGLGAWGLIVAVALVIYGVVEFEKWVRNRRRLHAGV